MIILADTPNNKGRQLEVLTARLLQHCGYQNCTTNVMANGSELDVRGEILIPGLAAGRIRQLICECKAHKAVIDMTQWCKFLGKIYHQSICTKTEVAGCFISLSGVNGHVQSHYDELRRNTDNVTLLHGDDLLRLVREIVPFISLKEISRCVAAKTPRTVSRFEVAYHEGAVFWIVVFSGGDFTLFLADGVPVEDDMGSRLAPMVESELDVSSFIDIQKEVQAQERARIVRSLVIATLFSNNGSIQGLHSFMQIDRYSAEELVAAAVQLINEGHLLQGEAGKIMIPVVDTDDGDLVSPEIYRILLSAGPLVGLNADYYQKHINRALLKEICQIQCGLPLDDLEVAQIIELFRLSPSSLAQALKPMEMIVTGRQQGHVGEDVTRFHRNLFRQAAIEALRRDFRSRELAEFFHERRALREMETRTLLVLKSESKIVMEADFAERVGVGRLDESLGGGFMQIVMLEGSPQPWELTLSPANGNGSQSPTTEQEA